MKIEFKAIKSTRYFGTFAESENQILYSFVHEDKLKYYSQDDESASPTKMMLEANFDIKPQMLDLIESSKIAYVLEKTFDAEYSYSKVTYFARPGFSYEKLQDVIVDIFEKFNL